MQVIILKRKLDANPSYIQLILSRRTIREMFGLRTWCIAVLGKMKRVTITVTTHNINSVGTHFYYKKASRY